jgi:hypothetical protein
MEIVMSTSFVECLLEHGGRKEALEGDDTSGSFRIAVSPVNCPTVDGFHGLYLYNLTDKAFELEIPGIPVTSALEQLVQEKNGQVTPSAQFRTIRIPLTIHDDQYLWSLRKAICGIKGLQRAQAPHRWSTVRQGLIRAIRVVLDATLDYRLSDCDFGIGGFSIRRV